MPIQIFEKFFPANTHDEGKKPSRTWPKYYRFKEQSSSEIFYCFLSKTTQQWT